MIKKTLKPIKKAVKKKKTVKNEPKDKYWICNTCADKKGWISPSWPVTVIQGLCGHCEKEQGYLTPIVDFKKSKNDKVIWD